MIDIKYIQINEYNWYLCDKKIIVNISRKKK